MGALAIPAAKQASWDGLKPDFQDKILRLATKLSFDTILVYGTRMLDEQEALYAQGRTSPGSVVTNAKPGMSAHNWGLAADLLPVNPATGKGDWNWDAGFKVMADEAQALGLRAGYYFKSFVDLPHIEDPSFSVAKAKQWLAEAASDVKEAAQKALQAATGAARKPEVYWAAIGLAVVATGLWMAVAGRRRAKFSLSEAVEAFDGIREFMG
jgi:hypothetical protein